ncbi:APC family permease [Mycolicibacterium smegmatis]|uniref:APC family permease n=1 Tax=Mycolicibacterium TaxID=1866885 RepID=UPI001E62330A|nr:MULTISPECIES: APC family permease [Mycolicibacterium]UGU33137.1 APC family permease [Mycolicibacterium smegmatis]ULN45465.1 APC family permease [Mycolicibacterium goodii]ULN68015.1 APC family permease [Mycolicibacterium smegmatis]
MSINHGGGRSLAGDDAHLRVLGYEEKFDRKIGQWSNFALGFLYLSPLVGVLSMFTQALTTAGPPAIGWLLIAAFGQLLVAMVFGEIVSQFPIAGGLYQWARRLWNGPYAWIMSWIYIAGIVVGCTTTAMFSADFVLALFHSDSNISSTPLQKFIIATCVVLICIGLNSTGSKTLATIAKVGLAAEVAGIVVVGLYLLIFARKNEFSVLFNTFGTGSGGDYTSAFFTAAIIGLVLYYGFEACGEVAEETPNPSRAIPRSMMLTVVLGGGAAIFAFVGYILAAPNLQAIVDGEVANPITAILTDTFGVAGTKIFLLIALTSFLACVMGQQAAGSRLIFSFARDDMFPGSNIFKKISNRKVPLNALGFVAGLCILLFLLLFLLPDALFRVAAFQMLAGYFAFQMVVFAALRARAKGWRPGGSWTLGKWGWPVGIGALVYGVFSMIVLARPNGDQELPFYDRWIALIGFVVVSVVGLLYMWIAKPYRKSTAPEGDAIDIANLLREHRAKHDMESFAEGVPLAESRLSPEVTRRSAETERRDTVSSAD